MLVFLVRKLYAYAVWSATIFFFVIVILAMGSSQHPFHERVRGKREPTLKMSHKEQVEECREKLRQYGD